MATLNGAFDKQRQLDVLGDVHRNNQNPLRMLELLLKGFCPVIIRDRVDVHNENVNAHSVVEVDGNLQPEIHKGASGKSQSNSRARSLTTDTTSASSCATPSLSRISSHHGHQNHEHCQLRKQRVYEHNNENPTRTFDILERPPPSDVLSISKKLLEGLCYNPYKRNISTNSHQSASRGFCQIILEKYNVCLNEGEDVVPPEGEECSLGTCDSYNDVDLSPQLWLTAAPTPLLEEDSMDYVEEEERPISEFEELRTRNHRALAVLTGTILVLTLTIGILHYADNIQFVVASKKNHFVSHTKRTPRLLITPKSFPVLRSNDAMILEVKSSFIQSHNGFFETSSSLSNSDRSQKILHFDEAS